MSFRRVHSFAQPSGQRGRPVSNDQIRPGAVNAGQCFKDGGLLINPTARGGCLDKLNSPDTW